METPGSNLWQAPTSKSFANPADRIRAPAAYIFDHGDVPVEIRSYVRARLGPAAQIHPARCNASYKGPVLLNTAAWLIQAVGKNGNIAVVHRKSDVSLIGTVALRDRMKKLIGVSVQVHYNDGLAKAYSLGSSTKHLAAREKVRVSLLAGIEG